MGDKSAIHWTNATWNPVTGCSKVSPGCAYCYAEALSLRHKWSTLLWTPENAAANVILHPERLPLPLHWKQPRMIFVNSMSDLFHPLVPDAFIAAVFEIMQRATHHVFQVLTKRPEAARSWLLRYAHLFSDAAWPLPNVWMGTSVENQHWARVRVPILLDTPAAVRFLSCEPLLGPLALDPWLIPFFAADDPRYQEPGGRGVDWVIVGGESGPGARPMDLSWARRVRDDCQRRGAAFFYKQAGGLRPGSGRLLDGREWNEFPQGREAASYVHLD